MNIDMLGKSILAFMKPEAKEALQRWVVDGEKDWRELLTLTRENNAMLKKIGGENGQVKQ